MKRIAHFWVILIIVISVSTVSLAEDSLPVPVSVEGVVFESKNSFAIVNGQVCKVGDKIRDAQIIEITGKSVKFNYKGRVYTLPVGSGRKAPASKPAAKEGFPSSSVLESIKGLFKSFIGKPSLGSLSSSTPQNDQAVIDKIFNTKVEPNPAYFEDYYYKALQYYKQAESQVQVNREAAFASYGEAAQAAAWAIQYSPRACAEKHDERIKMFDILNSSLDNRAKIRQ